MLSAQTIALVKKTLPFLEENGEILTHHFYQRLFKHHPETVVFFNSANQQQGMQQRALAAALCAYAAHIDNLDVLTGAVEKIAQKHVSVCVPPEYYPVVGEHLLESMKEVLGDHATADIIGAWGEAYGALATILIEREESLYQAQAEVSGGWRNFKEFKVSRKEKESLLITSLYLEPVDGLKPPLFKPGQHITLRLPTPTGQTTMRHYSLSNKPGQEYLRISVKREDKTIDCPVALVSQILHDSTECGDVVEVAPPAGDFFWDPHSTSQRPLVLLAGGVGMTPILSILLSALEHQPELDVLLIQACLNESHHAFKQTVEELAIQYPRLRRHYCYSLPATGDIQRSQKHTSTGLIDLEILKTMGAQVNADYYFCGPQPFMVTIQTLLETLGVPPQQRYFEFFGPQQTLEGTV